MVAADGGRCSIEGHFRRYFVRINVAKDTGIRQAWMEGGVTGIG